MKRFLFAGAAILMSYSMPAMAADMPVKAAPAPAPVATPTVDWTGLYVGGHAGFMDITDHIVDVDQLNGGAHFEFNTGTALAGGQAGYNFQWGYFVIGVEGDFSSIHLNEKQFDPDFIGGTFTTLTGNSVWDVTGRAGLAYNGLFVYFKGGQAWTNIVASVNNQLGGFGQIGPASTGHFNGTILGGGVEWFIFPAWSVKAEFQNIDLGTQNAVLHTAANGNFRYSNSMGSVNIWTVGLNYHFGSLTPSGWTWR